MRSGSVLAAVVALVAVASSAAQEPFQRDKVMVTRGRHDYVPLENPTFVTAAGATYLSDDELVLGLSYAGEDRAYPLRLMAWHHIVNDAVGPRPLAVVF